MVWPALATVLAQHPMPLPRLRTLLVTAPQLLRMQERLQLLTRSKFPRWGRMSCCSRLLRLSATMMQLRRFSNIISDCPIATSDGLLLDWQAAKTDAERAEEARKAEAATHARERQWLEKRAMSLSDSLHQEYYPAAPLSAPTVRPRQQACRDFPTVAAPLNVIF